MDPWRQLLESTTSAKGLWQSLSIEGREYEVLRSGGCTWKPNLESTVPALYIKRLCESHEILGEKRRNQKYFLLKLAKGDIWCL